VTDLLPALFIWFLPARNTDALGRTSANRGPTIVKSSDRQVSDPDQKTTELWNATRLMWPWPCKAKRSEQSSSLSSTRHDRPSGRKPGCRFRAEVAQATAPL